MEEKEKKNVQVMKPRNWILTTVSLYNFEKKKQKKN